MHNLNESTQDNPGNSVSKSKNDHNPNKETWSGKLDFILSCIGYAVGLGNVWRFPYLCYRNGGGAFLIPYVLLLAVAGLPSFFLEMSLGQFSGEGPTSVWNIAPLFKGVGFTMLFVSGVVSIYYNMVIGYTLYYLFSSFTNTLPWSHCHNDFNTDFCVTFKGNSTNSTVYEKLSTPSEEFWNLQVLEISSDISHTGHIKWQLALCLLLGWVLVFLCLIKGIHSIGKVVYFTATFPYVMLVILLVRGATLPGSAQGVLFYITPRWHLLKNIKVWIDAGTQVFFSLGAGGGGWITMSSYNKFHNNCYRDAIVVAVINAGTSVFAGFVIFSMVGYMAEQIGVDVEEAAASGPGLAFVAYPEGIARMPIAPLWSILFFFMLLLLGLDSQFVGIETISCAIVDEFPTLFKGTKEKIGITGGIIVILFLLGLPCTTQAGIYWVTLLDWYGGTFALMTIAVFECLIISWVYGYKRYIEDIEMMLGFKPNYFWRLCWAFLTPVSLIGVVLSSLIMYTPINYNEETYPRWADALGWLIVAAGLACIPVYMLYVIIKFRRQSQYKHWWHVLRHAVTPTEDWGPSFDRRVLLDDAELNDVTEQTTGDSRREPLSQSSPAHNYSAMNDANSLSDSHI